jgi:Tat protein secretion system quality control protein TatD with DNase activity
MYARSESLESCAIPSALRQQSLQVAESDHRKLHQLCHPAIKSGQNTEALMLAESAPKLTPAAGVAPLMTKAEQRLGALGET